ncbi:hypothetical protein L9F63_002931, partial [Diploptera punctata]
IPRKSLTMALSGRLSQFLRHSATSKVNIENSNHRIEEKIHMEGIHTDFSTQSPPLQSSKVWSSSEHGHLVFFSLLFVHESDKQENSKLRLSKLATRSVTDHDTTTILYT